MQTTKAPKLKTKRSKISYAKWGYIFIAPFFLAYALFHFAPQLLTIYNSFFENYREGPDAGRAEFRRPEELHHALYAR
ncbi:MAG: hypothetical protein ACLS3C_08670 [Oscillospiraceae bacterium]